MNAQRRREQRAMAKAWRGGNQSVLRLHVGLCATLDPARLYEYMPCDCDVEYRRSHKPRERRDNIERIRRFEVET